MSQKIVVHWKEGENVAIIGQKWHPLEVRVHKYMKTYKVREDAGGGCYWADSWETVTGETTEYLAYYDGKLIGEISTYNVMFLPGSDKHHLILSKNVDLTHLKK